LNNNYNNAYNPANGPFCPYNDSYYYDPFYYYGPNRFNCPPSFTDPFSYDNANIPSIDSPFLHNSFGGELFPQTLGLPPPHGCVVRPPVVNFSKIDSPTAPNVEKKKVTIETPKNLRHLLEIIHNNPLKEDIEYNIDLKTLSSVKEELIELKDMIGMEKIKESVFEQLVYFIQDLHQGNDGDYKHTVIMGPPGTGKTRVAKIIGKMYSKLGILKNNVFRKVTRNDLIAGYLGQTSIKTRKVIDECLGGVLFIDEAYSLANENNEDMYAKECLDTLCEALSDCKNELMVIIAGYECELNNRFFSANSGLESRFIWRFKMDDYNAKELLQIFSVLVLKNGWSYLDEDAINERWFREKKETFKGLGRDMEALFTYTKVAHGLRIYGIPVEFKRKISLEDMDRGYNMFLNNVKKDDRPSFINTIYI
jgi:hypothetical protein